MAASLKIVLFKGKKHSDDNHPIQLHLPGEPSKRKEIYKSLESEWDKKNLRLKSKVNNSAFANNLLSEEFAMFERIGGFKYSPAILRDMPCDKWRYKLHI
ncbi:hypothetical protein [Pedobacter jejuensis]|uniref:Arm DNA-binding domain-containing protein n=1 Tax=Pedobacter jejuensis TaxID=1268550 RepID=A0A3N0BXS1_9SPHI|nr:hypothetical protein [Pedobacter jejuensis]RNL54543.1 hypothetical protein D7004_07045 [Pedobacter jejuensis]